MSRRFTIGPNMVISFSDDQMKYNAIRLHFENWADSLSLKFQEEYTKNNHNLDDVAKNAYDQGASIIGTAISEAVAILLKNGIYDVNEASFLKDYYSKHYTWDEDFAEIYEKYMGIILQGEKLDEYRNARRQGRGRVIGGGFGLSGAAKGMVTAGAINIASGTAHMAFNALGKGVAMIGDSYKKSSIYNDPDTKKTLVRGIWTAVYRVHYAIFDAFKSGGINIKYIVDSEKAERLYQNMERIDDPDVKSKILGEALTLNPYDSNLYMSAISMYGDASCAIEEMAEEFGMDLRDDKLQILIDYRDSLKTSTESDTEAAINKMEAAVEYYGLDNCSILLEPLEQKLIAFKIETLVKYRDSLETSTEGDTENALKEIRLLAESLEIKDLAVVVKPLEDKLRVFDEQARTLDGIVFSTREETAVAVNELKIIMSIMEHLTPSLSKAEIDLVINNIQQQKFKTSISEKYITYLENMISAIDFRMFASQVQDKGRGKEDSNNHFLTSMISTICSKYVGEKDYYYGCNIPEKKNKGARTFISETAIIIAIIDCTLFGNNKDGLAVTNEGLFWHNSTKASTNKSHFTWEEFSNINISKPKQQINFNLGNMWEFAGGFNKDKIVKFLREIQTTVSISLIILNNVGETTKKIAIFVNSERIDAVTAFDKQRVLEGETDCDRVRVVDTISQSAEIVRCEKWYYKTWFIILTIWAFFPVGIALIWKRRINRKKMRIGSRV